MEETNVRYAVVNETDRINYEKQWQLPKGYEFISYDPEKAISICRGKKGNGWVVEKIFNIPDGVVNYKSIIFRGGND
jgi:hypothetical protein